MWVAHINMGSSINPHTKQFYKPIHMLIGMDVLMIERAHQGMDSSLENLWSHEETRSNPLLHFHQQKLSVFLPLPLIHKLFGFPICFKIWAWILSSPFQYTMIILTWFPWPGTQDKAHWYTPSLYERFGWRWLYPVSPLSYWFSNYRHLYESIA